jgi:hypothetical protein
MSVTTKRSGWARYGRWIGLALVLVGLVLVMLWGVRVYRTTRSLWGHMAEAEVLAERDLQRVEPATVGALLHGVRRDVVALKRDVGWLARLGPAFRWVPELGPLVAEAPHLMTLADALTEAGVGLWDAAEPTLAAWQAGEPALDLLPGALTRLEPELPGARAALARAEAAYAAIDVAALPEQLGPPLVRLGEALPLLQDGLAGVELAPELLGIDGPRTYLLLVLNEDELRPGGGFITGVGEVRVAAGQVVSMTLSDSYAADDYSQPYPVPPQPMQQFMGLSLWVFRDSNWSPDFPTAARQAAGLYRPGYPVTVDGVIGVDQRAVRRLVDALGPLSVTGQSEPITGATLLDYIYRSWAPEDGKIDREWWAERKAFMEPLAAAVLARLQAGDVDWMHLVQTALRLIEQKHLLVYLAHPEAAPLLAARGWDARLRLGEPGDTVAVIEANVGFNKASPRIARAYTYAVDLAQSPPEATLTLAYTHTSSVDIACTTEARYDPVYVQMMDRCYWAYLRAYVPAGAQLVDASRHPIAGEALVSGEPWDGRARVQAAPEGPGTVLAQAFLLPTASQTQVRFTYRLPEDVVQVAPDGALIYRLLWQKQPGAPSVPVRVILRAPQNAVLWSVHPRSVSDDDDGVLLYDIDLDADHTLTVRYRLDQETGP